MKRYILIYIVFLPIILKGAGNIGTTSATFLEFGTGTRALGMGEAYTAMPGDISAVYYNPAVLSTLKYPELDINHHELITDSRLENIVVCFPFYGGFAAVSETLFWVPPFEKIDITGNKVGTVNFYNSATAFSYGRKFGDLHFGISVKYIYERIDTFNYNSAAFDIGILKELYIYSPFKTPSKNLFIGLSVNNIGLPINGNPLPRNIKTGFSYIPIEWMRVNIDFSHYIIDFSDLADFTYGFDESFAINTGVELNYIDLLFLRGGYKFNDGNTYTIGAGMNYAVKNTAFRMDISYSDAGIFGSIYSLNFTFKLIPKVVTTRDKEIAEKYYREAIKYYINDDLDSSLDYFKKVKEYNPYYKDIDKKITDLEELIKIKNENEARENKEKEKEN